MGRIIALIGLCRSGKSTWAKEWQEAKWGPEQFTRVVVNRDAVRLALYAERFIAEKENSVHFIYSNMVKSLLLNPYNKICMDETNCSVRAVRGILTDYDENAEFIFINTPVNVCIQRAIDTNQKDLVDVIPRMWEGLITLATYGGYDYVNYEKPGYLDKCVADAVEKIRQEVKQKKGSLTAIES